MFMRTLAIGLLSLCIVTAPAYADQDSTLKKQIIADSIASYPGNCPCPYNRANNGSRCGKRSAYTRPGGASPICYEEDITPTMLEAYKNRSRKH